MFRWWLSGWKLKLSLNSRLKALKFKFSVVKFCLLRIFFCFKLNYSLPILFKHFFNDVTGHSRFFLMNETFVINSLFYLQREKNTIFLCSTDYFEHCIDEQFFTLFVTSAKFCVQQKINQLNWYRFLWYFKIESNKKLVVEWKGRNFQVIV